MRGLWETYLSRDTFASCDWRLALGTAVLLGLPILYTVITGRARAAVLVALAA